MYRAGLLLLAVGLLSCCHVASGTAGSGDGNVTVRTDSNSKLSFNLPFASGEVDLPHGALNSSNFDIDGVAMMPGGTIKGFNMDAGDNGALVHLAFAVPRPPDQVRSYFLEQFKSKGDEASQSGDKIEGKSRDGGSFTIFVKGAAHGSEGTIDVRSKG